MRKFSVGGRNAYYAIDEYFGSTCLRNVDAFKTYKQADLTARHLNQAYNSGRDDALVGLTLKLRHRLDCETVPSAEESAAGVQRIKTAIPGRKSIKVVERPSGGVEMDFECNGVRYCAMYYDIQAACRA